VRHMFHSLIHPRPMRVLPAGDHLGLARPGRTLKLAALALLFPLMTQAANYSARKLVLDGVDVVQLTDAANHVEVSIAVSVGNMAYSMKVNGKTPSSVPTTALPNSGEAHDVRHSIPGSVGQPRGNGCVLAEWQEVSAEPDLGNVHADKNKIASTGFSPIRRRGPWSRPARTNIRPPPPAGWNSGSTPR